MCANPQITILLVDDDSDILEFMSYNLKKENYTVYTAVNGHVALKMAEKYKPDLIVLDVMMPVMGGFETCEKIRLIPEMENAVIIMLSARNEDYNHIAGYDAGADDYVTKPIRPAVFIKKINSFFRRTKKEDLRNNKLGIDFDSRLVSVNGRELSLPKKEFKILYLLYSNAGKVVSRQEIFDHVWKDEKVVVGNRTIDVYIRKIRQRVGDKFIQTLKGVGYKLTI